MEISYEVGQIIMETLDCDGMLITDEMDASVIPGWDSVAHINLILNIEMKFGITFTSQELSSFKNVGDLCGLIEKKVS
ncbi:MAG: acyl carrier protein [bacterium]